MIRAVIDTNVLVTSIRRGGLSRNVVSPIIGAWRECWYDLVISEHILDEVQRVLSSPYFSRFLSAADREAALMTLRHDAAVVPITVLVERVATHPEDDLVLATAVSGGADYLVTLDRQLLDMGTYDDVRIVTPQAFVAVVVPEG